MNEEILKILRDKIKQTEKTITLIPKRIEVLKKLREEATNELQYVKPYKILEMEAELMNELIKYRELLKMESDLMEQS